MNRILLKPSDLDAQQKCVLAGDDYRAQHLQKVLRAEPRQRFEAGIINTCQTGELELLGFGESLGKSSGESLELQFYGGDSAEERAKQKGRLRMVLGLMRPPVLKRLLRDLACVGVEEIHLLQADLCEGDYSKSHIWQNFERYLILGAEQGRINRLPKLFFSECGTLRKGFSVQEFLQKSFEQREGREAQKIQAAPEAANCIVLDGELQSPETKASFAGLCYVAVGPERGWTSGERQSFLEAGFLSCSLGPFTLRTELAAHAALILYSY